MGVGQLAASRPWLSAFDPKAVETCLRAPLTDLITWFNAAAKRRGLRSGNGHPLVMVEHGEKPSDQAYESFIAQTGCLPTRDNLHDRFNALIWLHLPGLKASLNAGQAEVIAQQGYQTNRRGRFRDWATVLDENGLLVMVDSVDDLAGPWAQHDWAWLLRTHRQRWLTGAWSVWPIGHALLEKAESLYAGTTGHVWLLEWSTPSPLSIHMAAWELVDQTACRALRGQASGLGDQSPGRFYPMPLCGLPDWTLGNDHDDFYADRRIFRPPPRG